MTRVEEAIAFQGEHGAFSESAALTLRPRTRTLPKKSFAAVVRAVEEGEARYGLLPVENTLAGGVVAAYDAIAEGAVKAVAEVVIPIRHCLMGVPGASLTDLREVRSHPVALAQCATFFARHPSLLARAAHDTAGAAQEVAEGGDPGVGAIAAEGAADRYGLEVLERDLQDRADNQTRFLLIEADAGRLEFVGASAVESGSGHGSDATHPRGAFKSVLLVETENRAGALRDLLQPFADAALDLAFIESRPTGVPWTYRFLLEFRHHEPAEVLVVAPSLLSVARRVNVLGTFPEAPS